MSDLGGFSLHELFRGEAEMHAAALSEGLVRLESGGDASAVEPLMRAAHSIKGAARVIGLDIAVKLAHAMEDVLVAMQKGAEPIAPARIDRLLKGTDLLADLAKVDESAVPAWTDANTSAVDAIVAELRAPVAAPAATSSQVREEVAATVHEATAAKIQEATAARIHEATAAKIHDEKNAGSEKNRTSAENSQLEKNAGAATDSEQQMSSALGREDRSLRATEAEAPSRSPDSAMPAAVEPARRAASVRVTAEKLDRLLQLAGETMLEARRLGAIRDEALALKQHVVRLEDELDRLRTRMRRDAAAHEPAMDTSSGAPLATTADAARDLAAPVRAALDATRSRVLGHLQTIESAIRRGEETSTQLYHEVLSSRMRPFSDATAALPRTVRDLARALGKDARLEIAGDTVPVDRDILARLDAPLNHLLRNAIDHGVETPDERRAAGKPAQATLRVEARHHAGMLRIRVSDDGRGIDLTRLRERIERRALASREMTESMSRQELLEFLFLPGFSTAQKVTEISGRGVGLDVVQSTAREIGGVARIETELGRGTTFELELPITLSVIRALLVDVAGETLAFPLARIERVAAPGADELRSVEGRGQFLLDGIPVGVLDASRVLALADARAAKRREHVVVLGSGDDRYGFAVDGLVGEEDLVVRALDTRLGKVPHLSAAAVRENGDPVLIVDVEDVLSSVRQALGEGRLRGARPAIAHAERRTLRALVVDDSATVREVERQLLQRLGFEVETAVDGMDGWNALREGGAFDLVVSDIDMPRMNGIEFVRTLRGDARFTAVPVIVVSYKDRDEDRLAGLEAGATAYLTKGAFRDSTFADTVRELVEISPRAGGPS